MVTDKRPSRAAIPETLTLGVVGTSCEVTLQTVAALLCRVRMPLPLPVIDNVPPLGSRVPSTVTPELVVMLTIPLPFSVPELNTRRVAAVTVPPFVMLKRPIPPGVVSPPTSARPPIVKVAPSTVTVPTESWPEFPWSAAIVRRPALTLAPFVTLSVPLP